jgi:hypothetical protein
MPFHFGQLFRDFFYSLLHLRLGAKRIRFLTWFLILFPPVLFAGWFGFLVDNIFYRSYRRQRVEKPLFIIGNYRSGTTLLQRLIAMDGRQFSGMKSWEIYTAPSIAARKAWRGLRIADSWLGGPLKKRLFAWEARVLRSIRKHPVGIMEYEEDEGLFLFIWSGIARWFFYPHEGYGEAYHYFDTQLSRLRRSKLMKFYTRCIRRHVHYRGGRRYLAKNPASSAKIRSILREMPDARFIYLVRNPYDTLPSNFDFFSYVWHYFSDFRQRYPYSNLLLEMTQHFYRYPLRCFESLPEGHYSIVTFDELIADPAGTVEKVYTRLGYRMTERFRRRLTAEARKSRTHESQRRLTAEELGISREYIERNYAEVLRRFRFSSDRNAV